jgi:hypothetical protein
MIDRAIGVAGIGISLIFGVLLIAFPDINRKFAWAGLALGVLLLGTAAGIAFFPDGNAQQPPTVSGNCNNFGNNNFNCNTLNVAPPRATFSEQLGAQLLAHMSEKKPASLKTVGSMADQKVGDEVEKFLEDHGFTVKRMRIGTLSPPPDHPFSFSDAQDGYVIIVAPSAH